ASAKQGNGGADVHTARRPTRCRRDPLRYRRRYATSQKEGSDETITQHRQPAASAAVYHSTVPDICVHAPSVALNLRPVGPGPSPTPRRATRNEPDRGATPAVPRSADAPTTLG